MSVPLRIVILAQQPEEAAQLEHVLHRSGFDCAAQRVDTPAAYLAHLQTAPDVILACYALAPFETLTALRLLRERQFDIPFIIIANQILNEEIIVECLRQGADDYLHTDHLARLGPAVQHALHHRQLRAEKQQTEKALREREARFQRLAENAPDLIYRYRLHPTPGFEYLSPAVAAVTGYTPEEFYANPQLARPLIQPAETAPRQLPPGAPAAAPLYNVILWRRRTGEAIWLEQRLALLYDTAGQLVALEGIGRDVTQRKLAEEALSASELKFRSFFEQSSDGIILTDERGCILEWNSGAEQLTGWPREQAVGQFGWDVISQLTTSQPAVKTQMERLQTAWRYMLRTGQAPAGHHPFEITLARPGQPPRVLQWQAFPIPTENGYRLGGFARDLTERKQAEEAQAHNTAEIAALYRAAVQLFSQNDVNAIARQVAYTITQELVSQNFDQMSCGVLLINEAEAALTCVARNGNFAVNATALLPLHQASLTTAAVRDNLILYIPDLTTSARFAVHDARTRSKFVVPLRGAGGRVIGALDLQSPLRDAFDERARRIVTAFAEHAALALENAQLMDHLEQARQAAEAASRLKSEFLANTSHELRTPLAGILGSLSLILEDLCESPQEERQFVRLAHSAARKLLDIINSVLNLAKIEAGKLSLDLQVVDVAPLVTETVHLLQSQAEAKKLSLITRLPTDPLPPLWADPDKVRQILLNVLGNAVKFTEQGSITITLQPQLPDGQALISVQDTGIGIPLEAQPRLFQSFVQVDGSTTRKYGGTGLGLSISRRLAEMMGGSITLHSAGVNQGSVFTICLPLASPDQEKQAHPAPVPPPPDNAA